MFVFVLNETNGDAQAEIYSAAAPQQFIYFNLCLLQLHSRIHKIRCGSPDTVK